MSAWSREQREGLNRARGLYSISFWHRKCIEPVKRRHGSTRPEWQVHRFEIKGGISWSEATIRDMHANPLLYHSENGGFFFRDIPIRLGAIDAGGPA